MSDELKVAGKWTADPEEAAAEVEKQLAYVAEVSKNARTTWFGLIALMLFCGVTLLDVQDRDFFEYGASTQLPLVNVSVPTKNFFWAAPLLVTGLYTYLHLYLDKLWKALRPLKNVIGETPVNQAVYPWLISDTALEMRDGVQRGPYWFITRFVTLSLCWLIGPVTMALFWAKSWAPHDEWLTSLIGLQLAWLCVVGMSSWVGMCRETPHDSSTLGRIERGWLTYCGMLGCYLLLAMGWSLTENGQLGGLYPADLYRANFVKPDKDWKGRDAAWRTYQREHRDDEIAELQREGASNATLESDEVTATEKGLLAAWLAPEKPPPLPSEKLVHEHLETQFEKDRDEARAALARSAFSGADLRNANLREAFLAGLDLREARFEGADLMLARLEGANLRYARLEGANLWQARLERADLRQAKLEGAILGEARLEGADLIGARLEGANLSLAKLEGAKLRWARLDEAFLAKAQLEGAGLHGANLEKAFLVEARLNEANLQRARLDGAELTGTDLSNVALDYASLIGARLSEARNLTQAQIDGAFGDAATTISNGLTRPDHWAPDTIKNVDRYNRWRAWAQSRGMEEMLFPKYD